MLHPTDHSSIPRTWRLGLTVYAASSLLVALVVLLVFVQLRPDPGSLLACFARWDGISYADICGAGYAVDPDRTLSFFPGYPLLARPLTWLGLPPVLALLLVAHLCLAAAFVLLAVYLRDRFPDAGEELVLAVLLALAFLPAGFYFRMALSESLFLVLLVGTMVAMQRQVAPLGIALLIGAATSVRLVGVVLVPVFWLHLWRLTPSPGRFLLRAALLTPLCAWGVAGFMLWCAWNYGDPFIYAARIYTVAAEGKGPDNKLMALLTLEPLWCNFVPGSPCYYGAQDPHQDPWLGMFLANPVFMVLTALLIVIGGVRRWLNVDELLLSSGLLVLPYLSRSHEMCMGAGARYAAVVFPAFIVLGRLGLAVPPLVARGALVAMALLLSVYSAKYALNYPFFY